MSGTGLSAGLLQEINGMNCACDETPNNAILTPIAFVCKSLSNGERQYSNTEIQALGIFLRLEMFQHYNFAREVIIISDHSP